MGASGWDYYVPYQPDLQAALQELRQRVFETGDYWWAVPYEFGRTAADFPNRPRTEAELWAEEIVQESGTHSILDMSRVVIDDEKPDYGSVQPVTEAEAIERLGVAKLTRAHVNALQSLAMRHWSGRCAVLHDAAGQPSEIYFWAPPATELRWRPNVPVLSRRGRLLAAFSSSTGVRTVLGKTLSVLKRSSGKTNTSTACSSGCTAPSPISAIRSSGRSCPATPCGTTCVGCAAGPVRTRPSPPGKQRTCVTAWARRLPCSPSLPPAAGLWPTCVRPMLISG